MSVSSGGSPHDEGGVVDRLDEIQRRCDDSTEGPWWGSMISGHCEVFAGTGAGSDPMIATELLPGDAEFVINARTDLPALVATLRAVLDVCEKSEMGSYPEPKYDEYVPGQLDTTERVRAAIASALGVA